MKWMALGPICLKTIGFKSSVPHDLYGLNYCRAHFTFSGVKVLLSRLQSHRQGTNWLSAAGSAISWFGKNLSSNTLADAWGLSRNSPVFGSLSRPKKLDSVLFKDLTNLDILEAESASLEISC